MAQILETERLILRHLEPGDVDALHALYRDPEIRRYFPEGTLTLEETREELEWFLEMHPDHPELGLWATIHKPDGAFIGRCGLGRKAPARVRPREQVGDLDADRNAPRVAAGGRCRPVLAVLTRPSLAGGTTLPPWLRTANWPHRRGSSSRWRACGSEAAAQRACCRMHASTSSGRGGG